VTRCEQGPVLQRLCGRSGLDLLFGMEWCTERSSGVKEDRKLLVPMVMRDKLIHSCHTGMDGGHIGVKKTLDQVRRRAFWIGWRGDVKRYCRRCEPCCTNRQEKLLMKEPFVVHVDKRKAFQGDPPTSWLTEGEGVAIGRGGAVELRAPSSELCSELRAPPSPPSSALRAPNSAPSSELRAPSSAKPSELRAPELRAPTRLALYCSAPSRRTVFGQTCACVSYHAASAVR